MNGYIVSTIKHLPIPFIVTHFFYKHLNFYMHIHAEILPMCWNTTFALLNFDKDR